MHLHQFWMDSIDKLARLVNARRQLCDLLFYLKNVKNTFYISIKY